MSKVTALIQERTPAGGMNQDDSIITPSKDSAGRNSFQLGDYRYALHSRIGSSRVDSFGDLENIKGTVQVTDYFAKKQIFLNPDFIGSLDNWLQLNDIDGVMQGLDTWAGSGWSQAFNGPLVTVNSGATSSWIKGTMPSLAGHTYRFDSVTEIFGSVSPETTDYTITIALLDASENIVGSQSFHYTGSIGVNSQTGVLLTAASDGTHVGVRWVNNTPFNSKTLQIRSFAHSYLQWTYSLNQAVLTIPAGSFVSQILYQNVAVTPGIPLTFVVSALASETILNAEFRIVYMSGVTVLSEEILKSGAILSVSGTYQVTPPSGCTAIGIRLVGIATVDTTFSVDFMTLSGYFAITPPGGDNKTIGKYQDNEFLRMYFFNWNSVGDHTINYYDKTTNSIFEILRWSGLNFKENSFIKASKLDNWMAFTDRINPPRLVDTDNISDLFHDIGVDNFREFHISLHKWAPTKPIIALLKYDGVTNNYDKLKGKVYQWAYRVIYKGYLRSCWSPASAAVNNENFGNGTYDGGASNLITSIELSFPGFYLDNPGANVQYNYFDHSDPKFYKAALSIEIAYRDSQYDLWRMFKTIPVNSTMPTVAQFVGESNSTPVAEDDFNQLFDTVPFLAGTVEAIDNRFVFGDCLDEQPPADVPVLDNVGTVAWGEPFNPTNWFNASFGSTFSSITVDQAVDLARRNSVTDLTYKSRGKYKVGIIYQHWTGWTSAVYTTDVWMYEIPAAKKVQEGEYALTFKFDESWKPPTWAVAYQIVRTNCLNIDYFMFGVVNKFIPLVDSIDDIPEIANLPDNIKNKVFEHFENSRIIDGNEALAVAQQALQSEVDAEQAKNKKRRRSVNVLQFNAGLTGNPANAALTVGLGKLLIKNRISDKLIPEIRKTQQVNIFDDASRILLDIGNWYNGSNANYQTNPTDAVTKNNPLNNLFYNFRIGDRVRFLGADVTAPTNDQKKVYDAAILEFSGKTILIEKPKGLKWMAPKDADANTDPHNDYTIEVYTPYIPQEDSYLYYECGEWHPVLYPGTSQRDWGKKDWTYTNNAAVTADTYGDTTEYSKYPFTFGDCHFYNKDNYRNKDASGVALVGVRSAYMNPLESQTFSYWERADGRPNIGYQALPVSKFKATQARFGGQIVEQSFINNLNRFQNEDQIIYPSEYGRIRNMINTANAQVESAGAILLALGEREAWSIYVNRTTLQDLSGRSQVALSDQILGSFNVLLGSNGTLNPESVSQQNGHVWWWSQLNGSWVRYGRDGLTEISDYKMRNWFRELSFLIDDAYQSSTPPRVISDYDLFNEELVTYIDHPSLPDTFRGYDVYKGAQFSEMDTRWKSCHAWRADMYAKMNSLFMFFRDGSLYLHEQSDVHSTFFGQKEDVMWEPVFNDQSELKKFWTVMNVVATDKWSVPRLLSEYRGVKDKQNSRITAESFDQREDNFVATIKGDSGSPGGIINGDRMRSKALQTLMLLDPAVTTLSLLHYVFANCEDSPKNA